MINQEEINTQCFSDDPKERVEGFRKLSKWFSLLPDKQKAWNDLHRLTTDKDRYTRLWAAKVIGSAFSHLPDKQQAWKDLIKLINDEKWDVRNSASHSLISAFSQMSDKQQVWNDLIKLTNDGERNVGSSASSTLIYAFYNIPDKDNTWKYLYRSTNTEDSDAGSSAFFSLISVFSLVPDKQKAWKDLIKLTIAENSNMRASIALYIGSVFSYVPDKQKAWSDLHRLTLDEDNNIRSSAALSLGTAFTNIPDKQQAWDDLHRLTLDEDSKIRSSAALSLGSAFTNIPDKQQAWDDLHRLTLDEDSNIRSNAALSLGSAFTNVPDKQQAWNDLHRLTLDEDNNIRSSAALSLGSAFTNIPDKQQAWNDLHRLTLDEDSNIRSNAALSLGSASFHIFDKRQVLNGVRILSQCPHAISEDQLWMDLYRLTRDEDKDVRIYANHSLGKVSIFQASQTEKEGDYKNKLEEAIEFFEKASQESKWSNPSQFCLPFYRSFHSIIFNRRDSKEEVDKYLAEAKDAIKGSKSKELLFEAIENLANALKEVQNLENLDLETKKRELNFYRKYCDRAAELMRDAEETAPFATIAMRKGLPIIDKKLRGLFEEIQEKAEIACKESKGTAAEGIVHNINKEIKNWEIDNPEKMTREIEDLLSVLESKIPQIPENNEIFAAVEKMRSEKDLIKQYEILLNIIQLIPQVQTTERLVENEINSFSDRFNEYGEIINPPRVTDECGDLVCPPVPPQNKKPTSVIPHQKRFSHVASSLSALMSLISLSFFTYIVLRELQLIKNDVEWVYLVTVISLLFLIYQKLILKRD